MPRSAAAAHYCADIRAWFGLSLAELATYLGVSKQFIAKIECGKRSMPLAASTVLRPLLLALPPPEVWAAATALEAAEAAAAEGPPALHAPAPALPAEDPPFPPPAAHALELRRRKCLAQAAKLLAEAAHLACRARRAARWAAALPELLPPDPDDPAAPGLPNPHDPGATATARALAAALALPPYHDPLEPTVAPARRRWLRLWLLRHAQPPPVAAATHYRRLLARAAGLRAEAAALA